MQHEHSVRAINWARSLPFLVAAWLYFPFLGFAVPWIVNRLSENVLGLICAVATVLPIAGFVPYFLGWLSGNATTWLVIMPYAVLMIAAVVMIES